MILLRSAAFSSFALLLGLALPASGSRAASEVYPADRCVAEKLSASARACQVLFQAAAHGPISARERRQAAAAEQLAAAWRAAEAVAQEAGVDCRATTASSDEMASLLGEGVGNVAAALEAGATAQRGKSGSCSQGVLEAAARSCRGLLQAEADHLLQRSEDREREALAAAQERAQKALSRRLGNTCLEDAAARDAKSFLAALVGDAVTAATVSPNVPTEWTLYEPEDVTYRGRELSAICSGGTPYVFFARRGSVNKLLVYYQGGGACWSQLTCAGVPELGIGPTFKQATGPGDDPSRADSGFADLSNPENPFRDWSAVFIPYCTGDVHWGNATVNHTGVRGEITIEHKGFVNAQIVEKWAREHFVAPEQVFVTGSSAGAYGAIVNSLTLQHDVYPSSDFAVLGDAGNGVITQEFLEEDLSKWGIEQNLPEFIPALNVPLADLDAADLWVASAEAFPGNRFANYTTAFDGSTGGQTGFYNIMLNRENFIFWSNWWEASCEWNERMRALSFESSVRAENYRSYIGAGSRHTGWGSDKVYSDTTGGVPVLRDWIQAMIDGSPDWVDVTCAGCGVVLPNDPTPDTTTVPFDPPSQPFTEDGRIVCEE